VRELADGPQTGHTLVPSLAAVFRRYAVNTEDQPAVMQDD
jgi:hypothetical protein